MIENFINNISVVNATWDGDPIYYYHGDGHGDFEKMSRHVKTVKLLNDYEEYLQTQLEYVRVLREKETEIQISRT